MQHPIRCAAHRVLSFSLVAQGACALNGAMHALPIRIFLPEKPFNYSFLSLFGCILAI